MDEQHQICNRCTQTAQQLSSGGRKDEQIFFFDLPFKPDSNSWGALVKLENNIRWCHRLPGYGSVITQVSSNKPENLQGKISKDTTLENKDWVSPVSETDNVE